MTPGTARTTVLLIAGMRGNACRERLAAALASVAGVLTVDVNLYRARATVTHDPACGIPELLSAAVSAGCGASPAAEHRGEGPAHEPGARGSQGDTDPRNFGSTT